MVKGGDIRKYMRLIGHFAPSIGRFCGFVHQGRDELRESALKVLERIVGGGQRGYLLVI